MQHERRCLLKLLTTQVQVLKTSLLVLAEKCSEFGLINSTHSKYYCENQFHLTLMLMFIYQYLCFHTAEVDRQQMYLWLGFS